MAEWSTQQPKSDYTRLRWSFIATVTIFEMLVSIMPNRGIAREDLPQKRIVYTVPEMDTIEVQRDIVYKRADESDLKMDIYLPPARYRNKPLPGVLLLHGGPLPPSVSAKDWGIFVSYGQLLGASGLVAITLNHRFTSVDELPTAAGDIQDALRYVRDKADSFHLDRDRLCLWTFSGAGLLLTAPSEIDQPISVVLSPTMPCLILNTTKSSTPKLIARENIQGKVN